LGGKSLLDSGQHKLIKSFQILSFLGVWEG